MRQSWMNFEVWQQQQLLFKKISKEVDKILNYGGANKILEMLTEYPTTIVDTGKEYEWKIL